MGYLIKVGQRLLDYALRDDDGRPFAAHGVKMRARKRSIVSVTAKNRSRKDEGPVVIELAGRLWPIISRENNRPNPASSITERCARRGIWIQQTQACGDQRIAAFHTFARHTTDDGERRDNQETE